MAVMADRDPARSRRANMDVKRSCNPSFAARRIVAATRVYGRRMIPSFPKRGPTFAQRDVRGGATRVFGRRQVVITTSSLRVLFESLTQTNPRQISTQRCSLRINAHPALRCRWHHPWDLRFAKFLFPPRKGGGHCQHNLLKGALIS